jgi:DNA polymerase III alpha subunit
VTIGGNIVDVRTISTKNGQKMAFVKVEDEYGEIEIILFPSIMQQTLSLWERDRVVVVRGKVNTTDKNGNATHEIKILADSAREVTSDEAAIYVATGKKLSAPKVDKKVITRKVEVETSPHKSAKDYIRLAKSDDNDLLLSLKQAIDEQHGDCEVVLVLGDDDAKQIIRLPSRMKSDKDSLERLQTLVGSKNVILQ